MRECKFTFATDAEGYEWCDEHGYIAVSATATGAGRCSLCVNSPTILALRLSGLGSELPETDKNCHRYLSASQNGTPKRPVFFLPFLPPHPVKRTALFLFYALGCSSGSFSGACSECAACGSSECTACASPMPSITRAKPM